MFLLKGRFSSIRDHFSLNVTPSYIHMFLLKGRFSSIRDHFSLNFALRFVTNAYSGEICCFFQTTLEPHVFCLATQRNEEVCVSSDILFWTTDWVNLSKLTILMRKRLSCQSILDPPPDYISPMDC